MKSRFDKAPAREGSAEGGAAAPPGPAALRNTECHKHTPGEAQSSSGLREGPRRGWSGLTPGKGTRHLPSRAARPPAPHTPAGPLPQRTAPLAPFSHSRAPIASRRLLSAPQPGCPSRQNASASPTPSPGPRQGSRTPGSCRLRQPRSRPLPRTHHTDTGHRYTRISHRHHIHTRISHTHITCTRVSNIHGSHTRTDLSQTRISCTRGPHRLRSQGYINLSHTHGSHTHTDLSQTHISRIHEISHTRMDLTHARISRTDPSHTHTHTDLTGTRISHMHTDPSHTHRSLTHMDLSHTWISHSSLPLTRPSQRCPLFL